MMKNTITVLLTLFVAFAFTNLFGQDASNTTDANAPFVVNPNPHFISQPEVVVPLEETFGLNQNIFGPSGMRGRGNIYYCTTPRKVIEHRMYLNPTASADMQFCIYESEGVLPQGLYLLKHFVNVNNVGPGEGWYGSGTINFDLQFGKYYMIIAQWDVNASYWNENPVDPYPIPASFGVLQSGVGWNWAPVYEVPPADSQDVQELFVDPVAYYQIIVTDDIVSVPGENSEIVNDYQLYNNFPNPFNPSTKIYYSVPQESFVKLSVYDVLGSEVAVLVSESKQAGFHNVSFDATNLQSGIYFYKIEAGNFVDTKKMVLMK